MSMFQYAITGALDELPEMWPATLRGSLEEICKKAADIGYTGLELQICDPQRYDADEMNRLAKDFGLSYAAIATGQELVQHGLWMTSDDPAVRRASIDKLKLHIDLCEKLGAILIVGSMRQHVPDYKDPEKYLRYHDEAIWELSDYAAKHNVMIVVENITVHISNWINTIRETMNYVQRVNRDNVRLHLDTYSMLMEDNDIAGSYRLCADKLEYVHFTDGSRLYPGGSNVDFKAHMHSLVDIGYQGWISIECRPYPDDVTCARFSYEYLQAMEKIVEIERYRREHPLI